MQKIKIDKQAAVFFILASVLAAEIFIGVPWEVSAFLRLNRRIKKTAAAIRTIREDWARRGQYLKTKAAAEAEIKKMRGKVISSQEDSKVFSFISSSSKDFNVKINSIVPGKLQDLSLNGAGQFQYLPIQIKAKSKFYDLLGFLNYLQESNYFFGVNQLNISTGYPLNNVEVRICCLIEKKQS